MRTSVVVGLPLLVTPSTTQERRQPSSSTTRSLLLRRRIWTRLPSRRLLRYIRALLLAPLHCLRHLALFAPTIDSRVQLVCNIARMRARSRRGAAAACSGGRGSCCGRCDGVALVVGRRAGVVAAGHAGRRLVGVVRVGIGLAAVRGVYSGGGAVFMAEEAKSGFFLFGVGHFVEKLRMWMSRRWSRYRMSNMRQMCGRERVGSGCIFLARARIWGYRHCRDQVL